MKYGQRVRGFKTYDEQRQYTAERLGQSDDHLVRLAGRLAMVSPMPPEVETTPATYMFRSGISITSLWQPPNQPEHQPLGRRANISLYLGKRAGQLETYVNLWEVGGRGIAFYKTARRDHVIVNSLDGIEMEDAHAFAASIVRDMEQGIMLPGGNARPDDYHYERHQPLLSFASPDITHEEWSKDTYNLPD